MKSLNTEKVKTIGDLPSPRFGHTFTMISSNKAVLFGGAVSIASKYLVIKINLSSQTKHICMISSHRDGVNFTLRLTLSHPKERLMQPLWFLKCR